MEDNFSVSYLSQFVISSHKKIGSQLSLMGYNHYESYIIVFVIDFGGFGGVLFWLYNYFYNIVVKFLFILILLYNLWLLSL